MVPHPALLHTATMLLGSRRWQGLPGLLTQGAAVLFLVGSVGLPVWSAQRTARLEARAGAVADALLEAAAGLPGMVTEADLPWVEARFQAILARDRTFAADLVAVVPTQPGTLLTYRSQHYAFHLAASPLPPTAMASAGSLPNLAVMAWPIHADGPVHSVFFHPTDALRAYTRNLTAGYAGFDRPPRPGSGHRRSSGLTESTRSYRSEDDERWLVF